MVLKFRITNYPAYNFSFYVERNMFIFPLEPTQKAYVFYIGNYEIITVKLVDTFFMN